VSSGAMRQAIASGETAGCQRATRVRTRHRCVACRERPSVFLYRGIVKADADHTLCLQCYRALRDSMRAHRLVQTYAFRFGVRKECR